MKIHTTNYFNTFIEIADDCPTEVGEMPPIKQEAITVANIQFEMVSKNPYKFTSDDVLFQVFAIRKDLTKSEYKEAREQFFSKGQPCFRASPLTKRYGWGMLKASLMWNNLSHDGNCKLCAISSRLRS
jgi:hypothetical protein